MVETGLCLLLSFAPLVGGPSPVESATQASEIKALILRAGNAEDDEARWKLLKQLQRHPKLGKDLKPDVDKLVAEINRWLHHRRLDYFGRTVNIAARVQGLAGAREIVCTEPVWEAPGVAEASREAGLSPHRDQAVLKGIEGSMEVVRLQP